MTEVWEHFGNLNREIFGLYSQVILGDKDSEEEEEEEKMKIQKFEKQKKVQSEQILSGQGFVAVPLISMSEQSSVLKKDSFDFKNEMKNNLKVSSNESEILLSLLNSQLEIEEKRFLSTIIKRPVDHVIFCESGNYFTVQALNRLWNNENVCNEDTEFWMSSFKKASKCFCIPSAYLLKQFGKYDTI